LQEKKQELDAQKILLIESLDRIEELGKKNKDSNKRLEELQGELQRFVKGFSY
jgi:chaperonin cofactor prefoldin